MVHVIGASHFPLRCACAQSAALY